ncbi:MAG: GtrA family protein [Theionarchaea archaeon]|nr:GtrA family protein [Theionarchaea archaeon]MBU7021634.1 GtrA family protein [Theionarchaea archaeon]
MPAQFIKFCLVGSTGALIHLGLLYFLTEFCNVWYILSAALGFTAAVLNNFVWNRVWTFKSKSPRIPQQLFLFFIVNIISLCINLSVLFLLTEYAGIWYVKAQIIAILVAVSNNFLGNRRFTFSMLILISW